MKKLLMGVVVAVWLAGCMTAPVPVTNAPTETNAPLETTIPLTPTHQATPTLLATLVRTPTLAAPPSPTASLEQQKELDKFNDPEPYVPTSGPGGTVWDSPYRALIQTSESAVSKGLPSHAEAIAQILADAAQSDEQARLHLGYTLYIKHFSQPYRPPEGTTSLMSLYTTLVGLEFGMPYTPPNTALPYEGDERLNILRDVVYGHDVPLLQSLDAYLVKASRPTPVLIELHGGGWRRGHKSQFETYWPGLVDMILSRGISVVSVNYRLTPNDIFPAQVEDVARAIQFVRLHAAEWNIDPDHMAVMGGSAGAHLGAWVALHNDLASSGSTGELERQSTRLSCFVDMWGPMDLTRVKPAELSQGGLRGADFANAFTNLFATSLEVYNRTPDSQALIREASPLFLVSPDDPPALIIHTAEAALSGADHPPVPEVINDPHSPWFGVLLADALDAAGVTAIRYIGPDVGKDAGKDNARVVDFLVPCLYP